MKTTVILSLLLLAVVTAGAQDLLRSNPSYIKAREMQLQADQAFNRGDYDKAVQLADDSKKLLAQAESETTGRIQQLRANGWKTQAAERISYARGIHADVNYPEQWAKANALYATAQKSYDAGDYDTSITSSQAVIKTLEGIRPK
jgi:outer membrane protein assembly factor BamD (BamD/ComL family)